MEIYIYVYKDEQNKTESIQVCWCHMLLRLTHRPATPNSGSLNYARAQDSEPLYGLGTY